MESKNSVTIKEAAIRLGASRLFVQLALQQDKFPFGTAAKSKRWCYYINRGQFENYLKGGTT